VPVARLGDSVLLAAGPIHVALALLDAGAFSAHFLPAAAALSANSARACRQAFSKLRDRVMSEVIAAVRHDCVATGRDALHHAQTPAVLDHARTLPQGDRRAWPAFAGGAVGGECHLVVFDAGDVLKYR